MCACVCLGWGRDYRSFAKACLIVCSMLVQLFVLDLRIDSFLRRICLAASSLDFSILENFLGALASVPSCILINLYGICVQLCRRHGLLDH